MLFLRNTNRVQLIDKDKCLTIQKKIDRKNNIVSLVNSFNEDRLSEDFVFIRQIIFSEWRWIQKAGIQIRRKERTNNRGEKENYFIKLDQDGNELTEVAGIPDRIASAKETTISFAIKLDEDGLVTPIGEDDLSLYAYLPMNEHRFKFPFIWMLIYSQVW